jgi:hypothetical protein
MLKLNVFLVEHFKCFCLPFKFNHSFFILNQCIHNLSHQWNYSIFNFWRFEPLFRFTKRCPLQVLSQGVKQATSSCHLYLLVWWEWDLSKNNNALIIIEDSCSVAFEVLVVFSNRFQLGNYTHVSPSIFGRRVDDPTLPNKQQRG